MAKRARLKDCFDAAECLTLMDRETSSRVDWKPRAEQITAWKIGQDHPRFVLGKPRKTGITTAISLVDVMETCWAAKHGNAFLCVVAIDSDDKATRLAQQVNDFARQADVRARYYDHGFKLTDTGSEIVCATAGGFMPGRGTTIHRLHVTELPFWRTPRETYQALRSACADTTPIAIETTMDISDDNFARDLWRGFRRDELTGDQLSVAQEFHRHFFKVEDHASYRLDPALISDEEWVKAQAEGFTDRGAASWWLRHALVNLCAGEETRLLHDYPQKEAHLFAGASGRTITVTPEIAEVVDHVDVHGVGGKTWTLEVYVRPEHCSGNVFVTVDTAWGLGKTRSVVLVVDIADGRILASFSSSVVMYDDLARIAQMAQHTYVQGKGKRRCDVIVEINGSGNATAHELTKIGCAHMAMDQVANHRAHGADACIRHSKRMIETVGADGRSQVRGPPELAEECDSLRKERGQYTGLKDVVMTYGMALLKREETGVRDKSWMSKRHDVMKIHHEDRMKEQRKMAQAMGYGRRI